MLESQYKMNLIKIGLKISYYRKLQGMTQEELAQKLSVSAKAVSKWEQKINSPDITLLPEIANIFNISIDELFGTNRMKLCKEYVQRIKKNV